MASPDHAEPRVSVASRPLGSWPLRETDPVSVDGYRLVSRLGAGGMADVFYAGVNTRRVLGPF